MAYSKNASGADNQQGSPLPGFYWYDPSETTRRAPSKEEFIYYLQGAAHDATFRKKTTRFSQKNKEWLELLKFILDKIGCNSWIYKEGKDRNVYVLETSAKFLSLDFKIKDSDQKILISSYLRGFFDAEGGIPKKINDKLYIQLVQKNKNKLEMIKSALKKLDINTGKIHNPSKNVDPNYWRTFVSTKSHQDFIRKVWSWHPRKQKNFLAWVKI